ncbi:MAG: hypothetical protein ABR987_20095 [Terracidiphilus sp.]|jgi:uncharacterized membrane protein
MTESTPTGISDNGAGALSYITIIPAIVFLVMPPYNTSPYVRFHCWQSIFFNIAAIVLWVGLVIVGFMTPFFLLFIMLIIRLVIFLGLFALWLVCVLQALNGKRFMIPVIGALAEKQAGI